VTNFAGDRDSPLNALEDDGQIFPPAPPYPFDAELPIEETDAPPRAETALPPANATPGRRPLFRN
jgi:hypothetical protein